MCLLRVSGAMSSWRAEVPRWQADQTERDRAVVPDAQTR
ncbi:hypothetical protein MMSP_4069 [Mycobacterium sp. 012931]|nr:hypothetical protein MMSP_4069 [Mycobacterium sp. 012931]